MSDKGITLILQGTPISPGLAEGIIHVHRNLLGPIDAIEDIAQHSVEDELSRLDVATPGSRMISSPWQRGWRRRSIRGLPKSSRLIKS
jgi:hypothetical protein